MCIAACRGSCRVLSACLLLLAFSHCLVGAPTSASASGVMPKRVWDNSETCADNDAFMENIRAQGGPICDLIVGLTVKDQNYICDPEALRSCTGYDGWLRRHGAFRSATASTASASTPSKKVVLSIGHNGFGNQLFEHVFAQNVAQHYDAALFVTSMDATSIGKRVPMNTVQGGQWADRMVDPALKWGSLPPEHPARTACAQRNASLFARGVDFRSRYRNASAVRDRLMSFMDPHGDISCLVLVGYFQNTANPCLGNVKRIFSGIDTLLESSASASAAPPLPFSQRDIVVHLRCPKNAFTGHGLPYLRTVLNRTDWEKIYIVKPPGPCAGNTYKPLYQYIISTYGSLVIPTLKETTGFEDLIFLMLANKVVTDKYSTYSFWAGYFSVGAEVHVNVNGIFSAVAWGILRDKKYVFHNEEKGTYFGRYQPGFDSIVYTTTVLPKEETISLTLT
jgi:hypothetical protein